MSKEQGIRSVVDDDDVSGQEEALAKRVPKVCAANRR